MHHGAAVTGIDPEIPRQLAAALPRSEFLLILRTFEADLARLIAEFENAASAGNDVELRAAAHSIAGTAAGIGAGDLAAAARLVLEPGAEVPAPALLGRLRAAAEAALSALAALRAEAPG